ncbi:MAG: FAD-dependent thymidylate synthase [Acidobacteriota bacterium]|nr:FAD-dependent thymidylate synthase [Acidobacteriota bacterium]
MAKDVHRRNGFQCRLCGGGGTLHAHHVIPVYQDASKAFDEANLVSLCGQCHRDVHRSVESESCLAARLLEASCEFSPKTNPRKGLHLQVKFEEIVSVTPMGTEDVFDLVMENSARPNFVANGMVVHNCSWNEISGRYVEFADNEFFVPASFRQQAKVNKQGSEGEIDEGHREAAMAAYLEACRGSVAQYKTLLELGVCREQARCVLPLGLYSEVYWTTSLQAVAHFIRLRSESHAQWEIQQYAHAVRSLIEDRFEASLAALLDSDKG